MRAPRITRVVCTSYLRWIPSVTCRSSTPPPVATTPRGPPSTRRHRLMSMSTPHHRRLHFHHQEPQSLASRSSKRAPHRQRRNPHFFWRFRKGNGARPCRRSSPASPRAAGPRAYKHRLSHGAVKAELTRNLKERNRFRRGTDRL